MVTVYLSNETDFELAEYEPILRDIIEESLKRNAAYSCAPEISVLFISSETIRELNRQYRDIDKSTDVLSFPMFNSWREWPAAGQALIGDIVICAEQALLQSEAFGHSLKRELGFLIAHSMLHLMGIHHSTQEEEEEMCALQEEILKRVGLNR